MRLSHVVLLLSFLVIVLILPHYMFGQSFMVKNYPLLGGDFINRGDFNNDGILDLVSNEFQVVNIGSNTTTTVPAIAVFPGKADGTLATPLQSPVGEAPFDAAIGDFNHDGNLDVATISLGSPRISVLLGKGDGTFNSPITFQVTTALQPESITVADFNNDGNLDIAVGSGMPFVPGDVVGNGFIFEPNTISIFPGDGHGNFGAPIKFSGFGTDALHKIRVGDFNNDGKVDLAAMTLTTVFVLLGDGQFGFSPSQLGSFFSVADITPTDINQDGSTDLLVSSVGCNGSCAAINVFLSTGPNHSLQQSTSIPVAPKTSNALAVRVSSFAISEPQTTRAPSQPWAADVNGDGINDVVANYVDTNSTNEVIIVLGKPDGTYQQTPVRWVLSTEGLAGLVPGDFNRDGKIDFATTNVSDSRISVLLNSTPKAACNVSTQFSTVTLCTPQDFTFSNSPVKLAAVTTAEPPVAGNPITAGQVYVDNALAFQVSGTQVNTALNMNPGDHLLVTKFFDTAGSTIQAVSHVSVFNGAPGETCATPPNTLTICAPAQNGTFGTPLHVLAAIMSDSLITTLQVYIDNRLVYSDTDLNTYVDTAFNIPAGSHFVEVKAFDVNGVTFNATRSVTTQ